MVDNNKKSYYYIGDENAVQNIYNAIIALANFEYADGIALLEKAKLTIEETLELARNEQKERGN